MQNRYQEGQVIYAIKDPSVTLRIRRYIPTIYYCTVVENPEKELVYFERELTETPSESPNGTSEWG